MRGVLDSKSLLLCFRWRRWAADEQDRAW